MKNIWKFFLKKNNYKKVFFMTNKTATIIENIVLFDISAYV